jgi:hypothetical protein
MSQRAAANIRRTKTRPATSNKEALGRWGFTGSPRPGQEAYTADDYAADIEAGVIEIVLAAGCPRQRPELECDPQDVPAHYRSSFTRYARWRPLPTQDCPKPSTIRTATMRGELCYDCRMWLYWRDRQAWYGWAGFDHGLGYVRPSYSLRRTWTREEALAPVDERVATISEGMEEIRAAEQLYDRERRDLRLLAGPPWCETEPKPTYMPRYEQAVLLANVRRFLTCYLNARAAQA